MDYIRRNYNNLLALLDALVYKGVIDCSGNPNYPAADAGHVYVVSVSGKIGGGSGTNVAEGDLLLCKVDGTTAGTDGTNWDIIEKNIDLTNISITGGTISGTTLAINDYQFIPVEAGIDGASAPTAAAIVTSTNKIVTRVFRGATGNQDLFFIWHTPNDLTGTTITYRVRYLITESTVPANTETVIFTLAGVGIGAVTASYTTDQLLSHALGTAVAVTDTYATATLPAQYALINTAWSTAVTPTHLAAGKTVILTLIRDQGTDTYAQNVGVIGFDLKFTRTLA